MSDATKKSAAKKVVKPAEHPKYEEMIKAAIVALHERSGSSRQAIIKYIKANYKVGENCEVHTKLALKRAVAAGKLTQVKGMGASGSFKITKVEKTTKVVTKKTTTAAKKPSAKPKVAKPKTTKPKKAAEKKTTKTAKPKKPAAPKKSPAKKAAAKPKAKAAPKSKKQVAKSPKKAAKK